MPTEALEVIPDLHLYTFSYKEKLYWWNKNRKLSEELEADHIVKIPAGNTVR